MMIVLPYGGIGNRIRTLSSVLELSERNHEKIVIIWERNAAFNARFEDVFKTPNAVCLVLNIFCPGRASRFLFWILNLLHFNTFPEKQFRKTDLNTIALERKGKENSLLFIRSCHDAINSSKNYSNLIGFSLIMMEKAKNQLKSKHKHGRLIGIHIRRGDNTESIKHSPTEIFQKEIRRILASTPDAVFFIASDNEETRSTLISEFGNTVIICQDKTNFNRGSTSGSISSVIDLITLSLCDEIIGSYYSSFSEVAARMGNKPISVLKV